MVDNKTGYHERETLLVNGEKAMRISKGLYLLDPSQAKIFERMSLSGEIDGLSYEILGNVLDDIVCGHVAVDEIIEWARGPEGPFRVIERDSYTHEGMRIQFIDDPDLVRRIIGKELQNYIPSWDIEEPDYDEDMVRRYEEPTVEEILEGL